MADRARWLLRWHNIRIAPVVLLIRLPIMSLGLCLSAIGGVICLIAGELPGFTEFPRSRTEDYSI